jgi:hypothetical protein
MVFSTILLPMPQLVKRTSAFDLNFSELMPETVSLIESLDMVNASILLMNSPSS